MATITNPDDLNALEAALKLKDATGCAVVITMILLRPRECCVRCCGADKAAWSPGREFGGSDTFCKPARSLLPSIRSALALRTL